MDNKYQKALTTPPLNGLKKEGSTAIPVVCLNRELPPFRGSTAESRSLAGSLDPAVEPRDVGPRELWKSQKEKRHLSNDWSLMGDIAFKRYERLISLLFFTDLESFAERMTEYSSHTTSCQDRDCLRLLFVSLLSSIIQDEVENKIEQQDYNFSTIQFHSLTINETILNESITVLERRKTPLANFTAGLLLYGYIPTFPDSALDRNEEQYTLKRTHDALNFFLLATIDIAFQPICNMLLWNMKLTTYPESLIKKDLMSCK